MVAARLTMMCVATVRYALSTPRGTHPVVLFGSFGKAAAIWFMMFNMFHGTLQPLAGASRTISQLAEDGLHHR